MSTTIDPNMDFNLTRGNRVWHKPDIYIPGGAGGRVVPNINDMQYEYVDKTLYFYQTVDVDYQTKASKTVLLGVFQNVEEEEIKDIVLLGAPGRASSARRLYVDRSTKPISASVDIRFWFGGSMTRNIRIFKGTDINDKANIISVMYDPSNTLMDDYVPLEVVATVDVPNVGSALGKGSALKIASVGYLTQELADNEIVTVVAYNDQNGVVLVQEMAVYNTSFTRRIDASRRYVQNIRLLTDFLAEHDDHLVQIPRNATIDTVLLQAEVVYSNNEVRKVPIDGTRMQLHGTYSQRYIANRDGHTASLVLTYILDENEFLYGASIGEVAHKSEIYQVETTPFEAVFGCRIHAVPMWMGDLEGYRMRYFLTTLRRDSVIDVTNLVRHSPVSPTFDGKLYNARQALDLTLDMDQVSPIFQKWKYVQPTDVILYGPGYQDGTNWTVNYQPGQATAFGLNNKAKGDYITAGSWRLDVSNNEASYESWISRMFYNTLPIHNPDKETVSPPPTHFKLTIPGGDTVEFKVEEYNQPLALLGQPTPGITILMEFIHRTGNGDLCLGTVGLPFKQVD